MKLAKLCLLFPYLSVVDTDQCVGCQECVERCFFSAIEMRLTLNSKTKKAYIVNDSCMGCDSCIIGCKQNALTFELIRPPEHIPERQPLRFPKPATYGMSIVHEEDLQ